MLFWLLPDKFVHWLVAIDNDFAIAITAVAEITLWAIMGAIITSVL